ALAPVAAMRRQRTAGNPLFLEESVRALVETGALRGKPGDYRLVRPVPAVEIPASVQAVLAARIDRLAPDDKRLLQCAAVIGYEASLSLLRVIAGADEAGLREGLTRLQAAELLYETRLYPEVEYTFKHALTHDVAYGSLLRVQRRALHAAIVGALEARDGDEHAEALAHHARLGEDWTRAARYARLAADRAAAFARTPSRSPSMSAPSRPWAGCRTRKRPHARASTSAWRCARHYGARAASTGSRRCSATSRRSHAGTASRSGSTPSRASSRSFTGH